MRYVITDKSEIREIFTKLCLSGDLLNINLQKNNDITGRFTNITTMVNKPKISDADFNYVELKIDPNKSNLIQNNVDISMYFSYNEQRFLTKCKVLKSNMLTSIVCILLPDLIRVVELKRL